MAIGLFHNANEGDMPDDEFGLFDGTIYSAHQGSETTPNLHCEKLEAFVYDASELLAMSSVNMTLRSVGVAKGEAYEVLELIGSARQLPSYSLPESRRYRKELRGFEAKTNMFIELADLVHPEIKPIILRPVL